MRHHLILLATLAFALAMASPLAGSATRSALIHQAEALIHKAEAAIHKLESQGHNDQTQPLRTLLDDLRNTERRVKTAHGEMLYHILAMEESHLHHLEKKLNEEIGKIPQQSQFIVDEEVSANLQTNGTSEEEVLKHVKSLISKIKDAIKQLQAKHKDIKSLQTLLEDAEQIEHLIEKHHGEIDKLHLEELEEVLKNLEQRLKFDLNNPSTGVGFLDSKTDLASLKLRLEKLRKEVEPAIAQLKASGKHPDVLLQLGIMEYSIDNTERQLAHVDPSTEVGKEAVENVERIIAELEQDVKVELKKAGL